MATSIGFDIYAKDRASGTFNRVGAASTALDGKFRRLHAAGMIGSRGFDLMAKGAIRVAAATAKAAAVGVGLATVAGVKLAKGAMEDAKAQRTLRTAIVNNTDARRRDVVATEDWISRQGEALGVTDDELRPALGRLVAANKDLKKAESDTRLAMDVSAISGKSLEAVTNAIARARNGSTAGLARLNVQTKDSEGKALSLNRVMKNLADTYRGGASNAAKSLEGKIARLKLRFAETGESIGYRLLPIGERVTSWMLGPGSAAADKLWAAWGRNGIDGVVRTLERLTGTQGKLTPILNKGRAVVSDLGDVFANSLVPALTDGAGILPSLSTTGSTAVRVLGFMADHATVAKVAILAVVTGMTVAKVAMIGYTVATKVAAVATGIHSAAVAVSTSTIGTRVGVMALDAAGWVRSTASTAASTVATGANTIATRLSGLSLGTRLGLLAGSAAAWAAGTAATLANTAATVGWSVATKAAALATAGVTAAQWALNLALSANPIGVVVLAIGVLVGAAVLAYRKVGWFRTGVNAAFAGVVAAGKLLVKFFLNFTLVGLIIKHWNTIRRVTTAVWGAVVGFVKGIPGKLVSAFLNFTLPGLLLKHWSSIRRGAGQKLGELVTFVKGLPGRITGAIGNLGSLLYNAGLSVIQGLINGIADKVGALKDKLGSITKMIPDIKGPPARDRVLLRPAGRMIIDGLIGGLASREPALRDHLGALTREVANRTKKGAKDTETELGKAGAGMIAALVKGIRGRKRSADVLLDAVGSDLQTKVDKWKSILQQSADFAGGFKDFSTSVFAGDYGDEGPTLASMKTFAAAQRATAEQGERDVKRLLKLGLSDSLIRQLQAQGSSGLAQLHALASGSREDIDWFNKQNAATQSSWGGAGQAAADALFGTAEQQAERDKVAAEKLAAAVREAVSGMSAKYEFVLRGSTLVAVLKREKRDKAGKD